MAIIPVGLASKFMDDEAFKWKVAFGVVSVLVLLLGGTLKYGIDDIIANQRALKTMIYLYVLSLQRLRLNKIPF